MKVKKKLGTLDLEEKSRTYFFPGGSTLTIDDAVKLSVSQGNTHQLTTMQGEIYIIPYKWLAMKYVPIVKDKESKK